MLPNYPLSLPLAELNEKDIEIIDTLTKSLLGIAKDVILEQMHWSTLLAFMLPFQKEGILILLSTSQKM